MGERFLLGTISFFSKLLLVGSLGGPATESGRVVTTNGDDRFSNTS